MTDAIQAEYIRAFAFIIPSVLSAVAAFNASRAAKVARVAAEKAAIVEVKMDGLLDARVKAAGDLGHAEGKAAGVTEERDRT
jgi:hypothetical protein